MTAKSLVLILILSAIVIAPPVFSPRLRNQITKSSVKPGALSLKHASLENKCESCHTPFHGTEALNCIQCHAGNTSLLKRQPTAFHASIGECSGCHVEHQGKSSRPVEMDHEYLASIGLREVSRSDNQADLSLVNFLRTFDAKTHPRSHSYAEEFLECSACHMNQDKHFKLFGTNCNDCHGTSTWKIARFKHPSPRSTDCSQCHQAPPSHYMMHFQMVSMKAAHIEHADVRQCFLCHQTTSWNDIKGVGWYKHH